MRLGCWKTMVAGLTLGALLAAGTGPASAAEPRESYWTDAGLGVGAILANTVYMPAKITYALLGAVTGGLTYALTGGSYETADNVWTASLSGSYVVVPDMLTGRRPIEFSGTPRTMQASIMEEPVSLARDPSVSAEYPLDSRY